MLGGSAAAAAATEESLVGLGYADTLPLRMCPGGMMSLIYASLILSVAGAQWTTSNVRSHTYQRYVYWSHAPAA